MPFINCKVELSLNWIENCVVASSDNANKAIFKITDTKLYVSVVTLSAEDNAKLSKLLNEGFKRTAYWNEYKVNGNKIVEIPRVKIENCNTEIDGRNFYDLPINDSIKQYDEIRKISTGQGDDYTAGCLLDFSYFEKKL